MLKTNPIRIKLNRNSFFQKIYRNYNINVQIVYAKNYKTTLLLSQMIEGEGIRVVDLSTQDNLIKGCLLISNKKTSLTKTFKHLENFFNCRLNSSENTASYILDRTKEVV